MAAWQLPPPDEAVVLKAAAALKLFCLRVSSSRPLEAVAEWPPPFCVALQLLYPLSEGECGEAEGGGTTGPPPSDDVCEETVEGDEQEDMTVEVEFGSCDSCLEDEDRRRRQVVVDMADNPAAAVGPLSVVTSVS